MYVCTYRTHVVRGAEGLVDPVVPGGGTSGTDDRSPTQRIRGPRGRGIMLLRRESLVETGGS